MLPRRCVTGCKRSQCRYITVSPQVYLRKSLMVISLAFQVLASFLVCGPALISGLSCCYAKEICRSVQAAITYHISMRKRLGSHICIPILAQAYFPVISLSVLLYYYYKALATCPKIYIAIPTRRSICLYHFWKSFPILSLSHFLMFIDHTNYIGSLVVPPLMLH